jgi:hypothetical protein
MYSNKGSAKGGSNNKRKANRVQHACHNCRKRKQGCDEERPCRRCVEKGIECMEVEPKRKKFRKLHGKPTRNYTSRSSEYHSVSLHSSGNSFSGSEFPPFNYIFVYSSNS